MLFLCKTVLKLLLGISCKHLFMNSHNPKSSLFQPIDQSLAKSEFIFVFSSFIYSCSHSFPWKHQSCSLLRWTPIQERVWRQDGRLALKLPVVTGWTSISSLVQITRLMKPYIHQEIINCFITYKMKHSDKSRVCLPNWSQMVSKGKDMTLIYLIFFFFPTFLRN